jgi:tetratricopeptide (TPR) repeat protein
VLLVVGAPAAASDAPALERAVAALEGAGDPLALAKQLDALAVAIRKQDPERAVALFERSLLLHEQALGPDHVEVAGAANNLGVALRAVGRYADAGAAYARALVVLEAHHGPDHLDVASAHNNLGSLRRAEGDLEAAKAHYRRCLAIREAALGPDHPQVATVRTNLGSVERASGDYRAAKQLFAQALASREAAFGPDHLDVAASAHNLGVVTLDLGDPRGARALLERALRIREAALGPEHADVASTLDALADTWSAEGQHAVALPIAERSLTIREAARNPDPLAVADALLGLAGVIEGLGRPAVAHAHYARAYDLRVRARGVDHPEVAEALARWASCVAAEGRPSEALEMHERALATRAAALGPDHPAVASHLNNVAVTKRVLGDLVGARDAYLASLRIDGQAPGSVARTLTNLATLHETEGDLVAARARYEQAIPLLEAALGPDHPDVAAAVTGLAIVLQAQGERALARPLFERGLALREAVLGPTHPDVAWCLDHLAVWHEAAGDLAAARVAYERALAARTSSLGPAHPAVATSLVHLGGLLRAQGDFVGAADAITRALAIREATYGPDHPDVAAAQRDLGALYLSRGDTERAAPMLEGSLTRWEAALGPDHPDVAAPMLAVAQVRRAQGRLPEALALVDRAIGVRERALGPNHPEVAAARYERVIVQREAGDPDARGGAAEALALAERALGPDHPSLVPYLTLAASLVRDEPDAARPLLDRALQLMERRLALLDGMSEREALLWIARTRPVFDAWLTAFDQPTDHARAWTTTLRWKGVVTRRARDQRLARHLEDPATAALFDRLDHLRRERAALELAEDRPEARAARDARLAALVPELEAVERALATTSAAWRAEARRQDTLAADVCAALSVGEAVVDVVRHHAGGAPAYTAFVVVGPGCDVQRVPLGSADTIDHAIADWRSVLSSPDAVTSRVDRRGAAVADLVWGPLEPALGGATRVVVVTDGALAALPFAALPTDSGRYLLETHTLSVLTEAQDVLRAPRTRDRSDAPALVVGGPDFGAGSGPACLSGALAPLSGALVEAEAVRAAWERRGPRSPVTLLTGLDATEDAVRAAMTGARLVHFATHGAYAPDGCGSSVRSDPMLRAAIALAGANQGDDDGLLTAREVAALDLDAAEVVVLSACETGLGAATVGDGLQGLARGLSIAGGRQAVLTLWPVGDEDAAALMEGFYRALLAGHGLGDPAVALRAAQLDVLSASRRAHRDGRPQSWAAFIAAAPP